jgi:FAD/FMN-containing dehydrogenase
MINQIQQIIKGEVVVDESQLKLYGRDASIFEIKPKIVIKPESSEDIKNIVKFVSSKKQDESELSLTVRGGGSDMSGGPLNESIILDLTTHMNKILEVNNDGYAVAEPGVFYRDFEKETLSKGFLLPSYPASREMCVLGGMVANNSGGEKSLRYGKTEDYVEELNIILSDGNEYIFKPLNKDELNRKISQNDFEGQIYSRIYNLIESNYELIQKARPKVSKNSAGYALWNVWDKNFFNLIKLFVGSQGTLGIITKIKFRLIRPSKHSRLLVLFLKDLSQLGDLVVFLNKYNPESMESYDDNTIKLAFKILPDLVKKIGIGSLFKFVPDLMILFRIGLPKLVILAEFTSENEEELDKNVRKYQMEVSNKFKVKTRIAREKSDIDKYWTIRRESFNLLRKHVKGRKTAPFIDDVVVQPEYLPKFLPELNSILDEYKDFMIYTIAGHPGNGNFHIIPLMNFSDEKSRQIIFEVSDRVYDLVLKYGGSITAEHNDGLIRTPYLEKMYGQEIYNLFKQVKEIFDPDNIFNPRKKVGATLEYAMRHIKTDN